MATSRQHPTLARGSNARPGLGARPDHEDDHAVEQPDGDVVFSYLSRQRMRETSTEAHALVIERLRHATRQGGAASPAGLAAEVRALHEAIQVARYKHGPAQSNATGHVRTCYLNIAASAIILAERVTRPAELRRGVKSSTDPYSPPDFSVPRA